MGRSSLDQKYAVTKSTEEYKAMKDEEERLNQEEANKKVAFLIIAIVAMALIMGIIYSHNQYNKLHSRNVPVEEPQ